MAFMRRNFATQQEVYEAGSGWIFWAWKNDGQRDWSYQLGLKYGWIPSVSCALLADILGSVR